MKKTIFLLFLIWLYIIPFSKLYSQNLDMFKALYLYSFAKNLKYPDYGKTDFLIVVLGNTTVFGELEESFQNKRIGMRQLKIEQYASLYEIKKCNILYIPAYKSSYIKKAIAFFKGKSVVIVTDTNNKIKNNIDFNFIINGKKLKYQVRTKVLKGKNIKATNLILNLGTKIKD